MLKRIVSGTVLAFLLIGMLTLTFNIQSVKAEGTIYIRADGSIDPPDAPIITYDNITYTLTDNITSSADGMVVERNNVVVDGAGYTLQGTGSGIGIRLFNRSNVTVQDTQIKNFFYGILLLSYSNYNSISRNNITNNVHGIYLVESSNNIIYHNNFIDNAEQVHLSMAGANVWDDGYPSGGNYWSDYTGADADGDGIGDIPYVIDADNQDRYPLMYPWSSLPVHNINTGLGYTTIQEAINANETLNGHIIFVETGTYHENIVVNKTLALVGENRDTTVIDGGGNETVVHVISNNVIIGGFTIQNCYQGIHLESSPDCIINNNIIQLNTYGVMSWPPTWNMTITDNHIRFNKIEGITLSASNSKIISNIITNNGRAGVFLTCAFNNISDNIVMNHSFAGFDVAYYDSNTIYNNHLVSNGYGVVLRDGSDNNTVYRNTITASQAAGIHLYHSRDNFIFHNNFVNNTKQVKIGPPDYELASVWDYGYPSGGNYWSDYIGVDVKSGPSQNLPGSDGIGDTPYVINVDNVDHYPLMNPYGAPPLPLSVSINPLSASIMVGQSVHFTSTVTGGAPPYIHKWYLNGIVVPNATSTDWTFTPSESGTYEVWKGVTDDSGTVMNSTHAQVTVAQKLSVSISPASASISVGGSIALIPAVSGGYPPYMYCYSWDGSLAKGIPYDPGDGHIGLYLTTTSAGTCYVYLNIMDSQGNAAQANIARITIVAPSVGGYSFQIEGYTASNPLPSYLALLAILTISFTATKRRTRRETK